MRRAFVPSTISSSTSPARSTLTRVSSTSSPSSTSSVSAQLRHASLTPATSLSPHPASADTGDDSLPPLLIDTHDLFRSNSPAAPAILPIQFAVPPTAREVLDRIVAHDNRPYLYPETVYGQTPPHLQQQRLEHPWCSAHFAQRHFRLEIDQAVRDILEDSPVIHRDYDISGLIEREIHDTPPGLHHRLQHLNTQRLFYVVGPHRRLLPLRNFDERHPGIDISGNVAEVKVSLSRSYIIDLATPCAPLPPRPSTIVTDRAPSRSATPTGAVWDINCPTVRPSTARSSSTTPSTPPRPYALLVPPLAPLAQDAPTEDNFVRVHIINAPGPSRTTVTTLDLLDDHARCVEPFDNAQPFLYHLPSRTPTAPPVFDIDFVWELHDRLARIPRHHSHRIATVSLPTSALNSFLEDTCLREYPIPPARPSSPTRACYIDFPSPYPYPPLSRPYADRSPVLALEDPFSLALENSLHRLYHTQETLEELADLITLPRSVPCCVSRSAPKFDLWHQQRESLLISHDPPPFVYWGNDPRAIIIEGTEYEFPPQGAVVLYPSTTYYYPNRPHLWFLLRPN
ncbi:hypothetical protein BKA62DRAFT_769605 [Auriculariales sp. MPI-PUGE-AT-0066]|nr:hypothetical protein BKA62DRAFT_769605 [Auriculariales sp. MPI-PUGE-AT-0066]